MFYSYLYGIETTSVAVSFDFSPSFTRTFMELKRVGALVGGIGDLVLLVPLWN